MTRSADTVVVKLDRGVTVAVPLAGVSSIEVQRGTKGNVAGGMGLGLLAGAGAGALAGALSCNSSCRGGSDGDYTWLAALIGAGIGGGAGILIGGVIGASRTTERWERVPSTRWGLSVGPGGQGGFAVAVSVRF